MGTLNDVFGFEKVNLGSMLDKIKKDPERIFLGAIDPFSSKMWGKITGKEYEPIVNQLGGPQGSGDLGLGEKGGVYQEAKDQGVNTKWSGKSHDVAEVLAGLFGASGIAGAGGAGGASGAGAGGTTSAVAGTGGRTGVGGVLAEGGAGPVVGTGGGIGSGLEGVTVLGSTGGLSGAEAAGIAAGAGGGAAAVSNPNMGFDQPSSANSSGSSWMDNLSQMGGQFSQMGQQEQDQAVNQLAMMGPPPNLDIFKPSGPDTAAVAEVIKALASRNQPRNPNGVSPLFTPGVGMSLTDRGLV